MLTISLLGIGILFLILEALTTSIFFIWIGAAFIFGSIISLFITNLMIIFVGSVLLMVMFILLFSSKYYNLLQMKSTEKTSYNELIGKEVLVVRTIDMENINPGLVRVNGSEWQAVSEKSSLIATGEKVRIVRLDGVHLIVEKV